MFVDQYDANRTENNEGISKEENRIREPDSQSESVPEGHSWRPQTAAHCIGAKVL